MKILIACEESQRVCTAFRELGHEAYSCDVLPCSGGHPEWHIQGNVLDIIGNGDKRIALQNGDGFDIQKWDMMIAHPPCTYLTNAGAVHYYGKKAKNVEERKKKGFEAKEFFLALLNAPIEKICVENPYPLKMFELPEHNQIIQPFEHGHPFRKKTCLWLKNLPKLEPTNIIQEKQSTKIAGNWFNKGGKERQKNRSKTFEGIAKAMAQQWGVLLPLNVNKKEDGFPPNNKLLGIQPTIL